MFTVKQLLAAAALAINEQSAKGLTLADVGRRVGLTTTSVTYYFKKKEDLAAACFSRTLDKLLEILEAATDAAGRRLQVHTLSPPQAPRDNVYTREADYAAGYINFLPINAAVIAPEFGDAEADARCRDLLKSLYPGREIVQLNIDPIAAGGGGIHCVSKNLPVFGGAQHQLDAAGH